MPKFTVRRTVDAYANYEIEIEAEDAEEAAEIAEENESSLDWGEPEYYTYDDRTFVTLDEKGDEIEGTKTGDW